MDNEELKGIKEWVRSVDNKLENHLVHVAADMSKMANDIDWIKRFFWLVAGTSFTAIIGLLISLLIK